MTFEAVASAEFTQWPLTAGLNPAGLYSRRVLASPDRIWENVHDWEHLPALHESSFSACRLLGFGQSGWRIALTPQPGRPEAEQILQLETDRRAGRYRVVTVSGPGQGAEIRVQLTPVDDQVTDVEVRYYAPEADPQRLARIAQGFVAAYARLWDEDEVMMRHRESACQIMAAPVPPTRLPLTLGTTEELQAKTPFEVQFSGRPWRVISVNGALVVHAVLCPHWLGPLESEGDSEGTLRCPWHSYRFDAQSGKCLTGQGYHLAEPPNLSVDQSGNVTLISCEKG